MQKGQGQQHKRSWKNLLINSRYQLRFTLLMVGVCALLMAGLGFMVMQRAKSATKIGVQHIQSNQEIIENHDEEIRNLEQRERYIAYGLVGVGVLLCLGLFVYGIKMTHKVAGPLYKIGLYFDKVRDGKMDKAWGLRKGDHLVEFYEDFRAAHDALRRREAEDVERLREVIAAAEASDLVQSPRSRLTSRSFARC